MYIIKELLGYRHQGIPKGNSYYNYRIKRILINLFKQDYNNQTIRSLKSHHHMLHYNDNRHTYPNKSTWAQLPMG